MNSLNINLHQVSVFLATLLTGLSAGILFTWANAVTTGLARIDNLSYLKAFQQINRTILNPLFFVVFVGAGAVLLASVYFARTQASVVWWLVIIAALFYLLGVLLPTGIGNIPLNNMLDQANLGNISLGDAQQLRTRFEQPWNNFHLLRTVCSTCSFVLLLIAMQFKQ
jgi:uncharacterized membrane protein